MNASHLNRRLAWLLLGTGALLLTGCADKVITVKGTVLQNDKPIALSNTGSVLVTLVPDVPPDTPHTNYPGRADRATGNFQIDEPVLPGKYRIAVEINDPLPADDKLQGKFSTKNTTIVREIVDEKTHLTIDLAKEAAP